MAVLLALVGAVLFAAVLTQPVPEDRTGPGTDDRSEAASRETIGDDAERIADDLDTIAVAASGYDNDGVIAGCLRLQADVETARRRNLAEIASGGVGLRYLEALDHFSSAAALCSEGLAGLIVAQPEISAGTAAIEAANDQLAGG